ncbi:heavy-metal-associated domain-containing protein [Methylonatrum kenyense]|uniref:heavy-metal-associated domain-containing protein n=1 Tax=Methylonatrum kenyense TaxID=455253 RepID=UPI0020BDE262|nr:heavy metal-associated domain-containing protein [Methylonatrum kenyense]MCK8516721.1 heavy-metal-associated domain-containing protein [Methylonatrum kenyense]
MRYQFSVTGMDCGHCKQAVEKAVSGIDGVQSVQVELAGARVTVTGDVRPETVVETIRGAGYAASQIAVV